MNNANPSNSDLITEVHLENAPIVSWPHADVTLSFNDIVKLANVPSGTSFTKTTSENS